MEVRKGGLSSIGVQSCRESLSEGCWCRWTRETKGTEQKPLLLRDLPLASREGERGKRRAESLPEEKEEEEEGRSGSGNDRPSALEANIDECPALLALRNRALRPTLESLLFLSFFSPFFTLSRRTRLPSIEKTENSKTLVKFDARYDRLSNLTLKFYIYTRIHRNIFISSRRIFRYVRARWRRRREGKRNWKRGDERKIEDERG